MNTHDIKLPPLPEWADTTLQGEDRDSLFAWAESAIEADRKRRGEPVDIRQEVIETLEMILAADWRKWEELASPDEFVRWAKSRANYALSIINEAPQPAEPVGEIHCRIYHDTEQHRDYLKARFHPDTWRNRVSFEWQGHRWAYRYTHFDDSGEYDLIVRTAPQPAEPSRGEPVACFKCGHAKHGGECVNVAPQPVESSGASTLHNVDSGAQNGNQATQTAEPEPCFCDRMYPDSNPDASCGDCPTRDYKKPAEMVKGLSVGQLAEILTAYITPEIIREALEKLENAPWELSDPVKVPSMIDLIADDAYAATFQSVGQYRKALLARYTTTKEQP